MREPTPTILLTLLLACGTAQASDWVSIGKSDNGTREYFADVSSIGITGDIRRAWVKTVLTSGKPFYPTPWKPIPPGTAGSAIMLICGEAVAAHAADCGNDTRCGLFSTAACGTLYRMGAIGPSRGKKKSGMSYVRQARTALRKAASTER
jgi:hypothetical protein